MKTNLNPNCEGCFYNPTCNISLKSIDCPCGTCLIKSMCQDDCEKILFYIEKTKLLKKNKLLNNCITL